MELSIVIDFKMDDFECHYVGKSGNIEDLEDTITAILEKIVDKTKYEVKIKPSAVSYVPPPPPIRYKMDGK